MAPNSISSRSPIGRLAILKNAKFLRTLRRIQFSGQLLLRDAHGQQWSFFLYQGFVLYAVGGVHPVRRWRRNLGVYCPQAPSYRIAWQHALAQIDQSDLFAGWEYALLCAWVEQQQITSVQAAKMIRAITAEILFDIEQSVGVTEQTKPIAFSSKPTLLIEVGDALASTQTLWQVWQDARLSAYSPNSAPIITQPEQLKKDRTPEFYQMLAKLLNGQRTLRDLAIRMQRNIMEITASLLPYIQQGSIKLVTPADLSAPIGQKVLSQTPPRSVNLPQSAQKKSPTAADSKKPLIACVDDSFWIRHTMEQLLTSAGYRFLDIEDSLRAIGILLARKPDFIFLDLVMPNANGYEICEQLRKISCFKKTPIVILTGNDGYANRLKSNFVGATDFLSKPLDAGAVLNAITKHLDQGIVNF
ncbi:MAG: response regulator [Leptolyngbyaceae cyanobacterium MO_188.B28]|nr:response regulator [Leptolyngbyaceae cyanobacterium MO_188.B28]